jgi:osmotically inducible lipoprotein OsmB
MIVSAVTWITDRTLIADGLMETFRSTAALASQHWETFMTKAFVLVIALLGLAACGNDPGTRALTGGAIGAGSGAVIGSVTPLGPIGGAVIGGVGGAVVGAATTPREY